MARTRRFLFLSLALLLSAQILGPDALLATSAAVHARRPAAEAEQSGAQALPTPEQFFGFHPGAAGEMARYPKVLEYFQLAAKSTDRVKYEELGKTTMGNVYAL